MSRRNEVLQKLLQEEDDDIESLDACSDDEVEEREIEEEDYEDDVIEADENEINKTTHIANARDEDQECVEIARLIMPEIMESGATANKAVGDSNPQRKENTNTLTFPLTPSTKRKRQNAGQAGESECVNKGQEERIYSSRNSDLKWSSKPEFKESAPCNFFQPKLARVAENASTITDFFMKIINSVIVAKIVCYTNIRLNEKNLEPMSETELYAFFGLMLLFGVTKKSHVDIHEIWSKDSVHHMDYATATMPRDRFIAISKNIVFDNIELRAGVRINRKFAKMEEIFDIFKNNIFVLLMPGAHLCVDETLFSFRGKCSFRQYMPSKPAKYGIKFWVLVDVVSSYVLVIDPYLGKDESSTPRGGVSVGESVVQKLVSQYSYKEKRVLVCDNFFSSIDLAASLYNKGIHFVGTLRKNKKEIPNEFQPNRQRAIESSLFGFSKNLSLVSYVPKKSRAVLVLSTHHHEAVVSSEKDGKKPEIILLYNQLKGGVDTADHLIENFSCRRKTNRWTFNVLQYLLDVAAHNAFCLYKTKCPEITETNKCRQRRLSLEKLATDLIKPLITERVMIRSENNFSGVSLSIMESIKRTNAAPPELLVTRQERSPSTSSPKTSRFRCTFCPYHKDMSKYATRCSHCTKHVCPRHCETITTTTCNKCMME